MLKNIRLHVEKDEEKQAAIEQDFAKLINQRHSQNLNVFQRNIPSLLPYSNILDNHNIALMVNKCGQANIVDYGLGRVLYGLDPEGEVGAQVRAFLNFPQFVSLDKGVFDPSSEAIAFQQGKPSSLIPTKPLSADYTLVCLGLGLGLQLEHLLANTRVKNLIVYEPEVQYFKCSSLATDWKKIFELAKKNDTNLFFQLEKDGRNLIQDISELREHFDFSGFYIYQHYHHPVFDGLVKALRRDSWSTINQQSLSFDFNPSNEAFTPKWTVPIELESHRIPSKSSDLYLNNLAAFKKYFPDVYADFKDYEPNIWVPVVNRSGEVNLLNRSNGAAWYGESPKSDSETGFAGFADNPNKDGLVLGYTGEKLKHYIHYKFVQRTEELLSEVEESAGKLPKDVKSLILFGMGSGYQLQALLNSHNVEKLFVCEPNRDFFHASLFAIDWQSLLSKIDSLGGRIYLNIGDDGSNLFRDLLNQFYAIGPYILASTYFYQGYYNSSLNDAIAQLREQLQVVISMGEYFDHARYGIAHTVEGISQGIPHLVKTPSSQLSADEKDVPVFFIGNGPSLDYSIDTIKEWQDHAILISCGTALQVLRKNGITPDFHAEIEQNRSTYDWAARVGDFDFLKQISLLSCNGIHPDTRELYKQTYVAFKEGESSTISTLNVAGENKFEVLQFAFPTVTNFAVNLFAKLGFTQLYLFGVDLGFKDATKHHSKQSGYYDADGTPLYDYREKNNTSLVVPGNFSSTVYTKHEFKISKMVIEQSIAGAGLDCYNTSNGAKIIGSTPLAIENVLLTSAPATKESSLIGIKQRCFVTIDNKAFSLAYTEKYSTSRLSDELDKMIQVLQQKVSNMQQAEGIIEKQKEMLFASYSLGKSLLFYYLYGTSNYANAFLSKLINSSGSELEKVSLFNQGLDIWLGFAQKIKHALALYSEHYDTSSAMGERRIYHCLRHNLNKTKLVLITNSTSFAESLRVQIDWYEIPVDWKVWSERDFVTKIETLDEKYRDCYFIVYLKKALTKIDYDKNALVMNLSKCAKGVVDCHEGVIEPEEVCEGPDNLTLLQAMENTFTRNLPLECQDVSLSQYALQYFSITALNEFQVVIPKYSYFDMAQLLQTMSVTSWQGWHCYDLGWCFGLGKRYLEHLPVIANGTRLLELGTDCSSQYWADCQIEQELFERQKAAIWEGHPYIWKDEYYVSR